MRNFPDYSVASQQFSIETTRKKLKLSDVDRAPTYDTGGEVGNSSARVVSVFWFSRLLDLRTVVETNSSRDQWLAALAGNYELLPRERNGWLDRDEQRETEERRGE